MTHYYWLETFYERVQEHAAKRVQGIVSPDENKKPSNCFGVQVVKCMTSQQLQSIFKWNDFDISNQQKWTQVRDYMVGRYKRTCLAVPFCNEHQRPVTIECSKSISRNNFTLQLVCKIAELKKEQKQ